MEAAPGKILSILFLNQTCSRDNHVRVQDTHDGWSTALDGCIPWISPGYDVTTAARSAVVVIHLHNLSTFFMLTVQIQAVRTKDGVMTRYVSPALGYVQTPSWHPFTRPFAGDRGLTEGTATVIVPSNHVTLISVVHMYFHPISVPPIRLLVVSQHSDTPREEWRVNFKVPERPDDVLLAGLTRFLVEVNTMQVDFFCGLRVLFSFHQPLLSPQRHHEGLWNCSVPFWPVFRLHFACNYKTECAGGKDEMWCPDLSCHQGGIQLNGICYTLYRLSREKTTWFHKNSLCEQRGASLPSFPTVNSWYHLAVLSQLKLRLRAPVPFGLRTVDVTYPHMYRYAVRTHNGFIVHYVRFESWVSPPSCAYNHIVARNILIMMDCGGRVMPYTLCQTMLSPVAKASQKRIAKRKMQHASTEEVRLSSSNSHRQAFLSRRFSCPGKHWTQDFLAYDALSACCHGYEARPREVSGTPGNAEAPVCVNVDLISFKALFPCQNGAAPLPYSLVCNHLRDCADNSDEDFCVFPPCSASWQYQCGNGQCLQYLHYCDDVVQCVDESDEVDCTSPDFMLQFAVTRPRPPAVVYFDGRGWMVNIPLTGKEDSAVVCPDTHILCPVEGYCVPVYVRCNAVYDCPGGEDEADCDRYACPGSYRCRGLLGTCLHSVNLCDGWSQCPQHDDELFCNLTCPARCTCLGHAFTCTSDFHVELFSHLRYLDASGTGLNTGRLVNDSMLVFLNLANCSLARLDNVALPNLRTLNLSDNRFSAVTVAELRLMENLRNLSLARNPLSVLFSGNASSVFLAHNQIVHLDLTGVELEVLDMPSNLPFPGLLSLNLSGSGVTRLIGDGFRSLTSLRVLDLRGCPVSVFPRYLFKGLTRLRAVCADNYKLCCKDILPPGFSSGNCQAPFSEISSCDALLRANVYRVCLSVLAALALSGNLGCFSLRALSLTGRGKTGFNVFVTHLCVSDFVMGVYMAMIGVADRLYSGRYMWEEGRWRHSAACQGAGVLALLSSEVSALIICLITLDRFLVIRFPFSRLRFSSLTAQVASLMTWAVGIALVAIPLLPATAYMQFYGQTGICVPLPITGNDFAGHRYAFGLMILLNLIIFLLIAAGQICVYLSVINHAVSSVGAGRKSRDLVVARRLITVVVSDFLCWFPVGLLGVLATQGVPVPGEVNVAMAIFVLPLNSALNPFLYTLNIIQERRQRAREEKLLKLIMDRGITNRQHVEKE